MAITLTSTYQELNALLYHNNTFNADMYVCIDAKCTLQSGNTYKVDYRLRVAQGYQYVPISATSVNNSASLTGTGATSYSASGGTFTISNVGNNNIAVISATGISGGTTVSVSGHYFMGNYNWGTPSGTNVTATALVPNSYQAPDTPEIRVVPNSATSVEITYGTMSFGNPNTGTVTLYGGTSPNPTTVLDTYSEEGYTQYSDTSLTTGTTYYYRAKAENAQVASGYSAEVAITLPATTGPKYYGSVADESTRIVKMYGSVNSQSKKIEKIYGSVNGQAKRIFQFGHLICYIKDRTLPPLRVGPANPRRRDNRRGKWQSKPDQEW